MPRRGLQKFSIPLNRGQPYSYEGNQPCSGLTFEVIVQLTFTKSVDCLSIEINFEVRWKTLVRAHRTVS